MFASISESKRRAPHHLAARACPFSQMFWSLSCSAPQPERREVMRILNPFEVCLSSVTLCHAVNYASQAR